MLSPAPKGKALRDCAPGCGPDTRSITLSEGDEHVITRRAWFQSFLILVLVGSAVLPVCAQADEAQQARRHYDRGQKLYRKGQTAQAIEELYTALSIHEVYLEAQLLLTRALIAAERPREAFGTLRAIDFIHWPTAEVQKLFGQAFYQMNKLEEAEHALQSALSLVAHPDPELHYILGLIKLRRGEAQGAVREAEHALAIRPRFTPAYKLLSDAYLLQGEPKRAEQELARYLRGVRNRAEAQYLKRRLAIIRSLAGAKDEDSVEASFAKPQVHSVPQPEYTQEARRNRIEGTVKAQVLFGNDGHVQQTIIVQGLGFGLDEESLRAAQKISFTPGSVNDKPVSVWGGVSFRFVLIRPDERPEKKKEGNIAAHGQSRSAR